MVGTGRCGNLIPMSSNAEKATEGRAPAIGMGLIVAGWATVVSKPGPDQLSLIPASRTVG